LAGKVLSGRRRPRNGAAGKIPGLFVLILTVPWRMRIYTSTPEEKGSGRDPACFEGFRQAILPKGGEEKNARAFSGSRKEGRSWTLRRRLLASVHGRPPFF
jgi:hypothetical protein